MLLSILAINVVIMFLLLLSASWKLDWRRSSDAQVVFFQLENSSLSNSLILYIFNRKFCRRGTDVDALIAQTTLAQFYLSCRVTSFWTFGALSPIALLDWKIIAFLLPDAVFFGLCFLFEGVIRDPLFYLLLFVLYVNFYHIFKLRMIDLRSWLQLTIGILLHVKQITLSATTI